MGELITMPARNTEAETALPRQSDRPAKVVSIDKAFGKTAITDADNQARSENANN